MISEHLTEKELSSVLRCSLSKLRADRYNRRGVPYRKNGRNVIYDSQDVREYLEKIKIDTK